MKLRRRILIWTILILSAGWTVLTWNPGNDWDPIVGAWGVGPPELRFSSNHRYRYNGELSRVDTGRWAPNRAPIYATTLSPDPITQVYFTEEELRKQLSLAEDELLPPEFYRTSVSAYVLKSDGKLPPRHFVLAGGRLQEANTGVAGGRPRGALPEPWLSRAWRELGGWVGRIRHP